MEPGPGRRGLSRRQLLQAGLAAGTALSLAACGAPIVVERVVVVSKIVEHEVVVERPVITEREVIVTREVVVEKEVVVTRVVTPPPTPAPVGSSTAVAAEPPLQTMRAQLRAALSPAFARAGAPDFSTVDPIAEMRLEVLDAGGDGPARLLARAAGGDMPDLLIGVPGGLVTALDALEMLAPLDAALGAAHAFLPEMLALGRRDRGLVGMPVSGHATHLLAGRQLLDLGGIAEVGATYEALGETARRLTDPESYRYGFGVVAGLPELETVAGSAGRFPTDEAAWQAWQWYADQWLRDGTSPPPSSWDDQGAAGETLLDGRIALTIAHGRALPRLAALPPDRRAAWQALPLPAWPEAERRVPLAAALIAVRPRDDEIASEAALALAGQAGTLDSREATPAWTMALDDAGARLGLDPDTLLEARGAWSRPIVETAEWQARAMELDVAVHDSLTLGRPAADTAVTL